MRPKKKSKKKKPAPPSLPAQEETLVTSLLQDFEDSDPAQVVARLPDSRLARVFVERLPLNDDSTIHVLTAIHQGFQDKQVRKAIKRALFRLEKRGVAVEGFREEKDSTTAVFIPAERKKPVAHLGPIDSNGFRAVLIELHRAMKGVDLGVGLISDEHGIQQFIFANFSKKRTRQMKEDLSRDVGPLVETSLAHAATVLEKAYGRHTEIHSNAPTEYLEVRPWLLENVSLLDRPIIYDSLPEGSVPEGTVNGSQLEKLFQHSLLEFWIDDLESLKPFMEDILKLDDSPLLLNDAQKADRAGEIKKKGIEKLFPLFKRALLKYRLEEMAYLFFKLEDEESSRLALAAALTAEQEDTVLKPNPLIEFLFDRSLNFYMDSAKKATKEADTKDDVSSGIILP
jgi:hypothetical protein